MLRKLGVQLEGESSAPLIILKRWKQICQVYILQASLRGDGHA